MVSKNALLMLGLLVTAILIPAEVVAMEFPETSINSKAG